MPPGAASRPCRSSRRADLERVGLAKTRRVARHLDASVTLSVRWRGGDLFRLLDEGHASLVEAVVTRLRAEGWELIVEYSFNHYGERGSVDILAWNARHAVLLIVEVKSRIVDVQELLGTLDRTVRVVPLLVGRERGWRAKQVGRLVVLPPTSAARAAVDRHRETFDVALPDRGLAIRRWLAAPVGPLRGVWFLADTNSAGAKKRSRPR